MSESDVTSLLTMEETLRIIEEAFRDLGEGKATNHPRYRLASLNTILNVMSAGLPRLRVSGLKVYGASRGGISFIVLLLDAESGEWLSIMAANKLGQTRTGAASGVATKYLARKDATTLGLYGTGWQARSQIEAISRVRKLERIKCYSRNFKSAEDFAREIHNYLGVDIVAVAEPMVAAEEADIVVTATTSRDPVVSGDWLEEGVHINGIGANDLRRRELDSAAIARCDLIFVDSIEQSKIESGDLAFPVSEGMLEWSKVQELGKLVAGKVSGRRTTSETTLFKSNGIAVEDVVTAKYLYDLAVSRGVGREIELFK